MLINTIDLLPRLEIDMQKFQRNLDAVHTGVERIPMSTRMGEGLDEWCAWLAQEVEHAEAHRLGVHHH